jgi:hypothetical protein
MFTFENASDGVKSLADKADAAQGAESMGWEPLSDGGVRFHYPSGAHRDYSKLDLLDEEDLMTPQSHSCEDDFDDWKESYDYFG